MTSTVDYFAKKGVVRGSSSQGWGKYFRATRFDDLSFSYQVEFAISYLQDFNHLSIQDNIPAKDVFFAYLQNPNEFNRGLLFKSFIRSNFTQLDEAFSEIMEVKFNPDPSDYPTYFDDENVALGGC